MALPTALSLPAQVAAQAELIVSNLQQTDYQHTEHGLLTPGRGLG